MKRQILSLILLLSTPSFVLAQDTEKNDALKVAVVDIGEVIEGYKGRAKYELALSKVKAEGRANLREQNSLIAELSRESQRYQGQKRERLDDRISLEKSRLTVLKKRLEKTLKKKYRGMMKALMSDIQKATAECAKARGVKLVFKVDRGGELDDDESKKQLTQNLLFFDKSLDITKDVLKILNQSVKISPK